MPLKAVRERAVSGLGWNAATQAVSRAFQFAATVALARILSPHEFGLIGMILVILGFATTIADLGLGAAIIQRDAPSNEALSSAFWLNVGVGGALTFIVTLAAPLVARLYGEPQLCLLTVAMAFSFIIGSLSSVQSALLEKSLDFRTRFRIESLAIAISIMAALTLALAGAGVWSLVAQVLSEAVARAGLVWLMVSWRPRRVFSVTAIGDLLVFGRHLIGFRIVVYLAQNIDKLIIGRHLGSAALGVYSIADRVMRMPLTNITDTAGTVMFPALAAFQDDIDAVKRAYLRANRMIALVTFPMMLGISVLAQPLVLLVYGEKWHNAVGIVQVLCFAGLAQSVYNTAGWIFLSRGRSDILFRFGFLSMLVRGLGVLVGMHWGLLGIAWAYVVGGFLALMLPNWAAAGRLIGLGLGDLVKNVVGPFCCAVGMAALIALSDHGLFSGEAHWLRLIVQVPAGIVIYGILVSLFRLAAWHDVRALILERGGPTARFVSGPIGKLTWR
jgi:O-antigen/teichoic acid export membrane protein